MSEDEDTLMSIKNNNDQVTIYADDDPDGILSARQITNYYKDQKKKCKLFLADWKDFGLPMSHVDQINETHAQEIYILDVGSDKSTLETIKKLKGEIYVIDNHPPTPANPEYESWCEYVEKLPSNIHLTTTTESCTAGLTWDLLDARGYSNEWNDIWAIVGLEADVAIDKGLGKITADKILQKHPSLGAFLQSIYKKSGQTTWSTLEYPILSRFSAILNAGRRTSYNEGTALAFRATGDIEKIGDVFSLVTLKPAAIADNPNYLSLWNLLTCYVNWDDRWFKESISKAIHLKYPKLFGVSVLTHEWNLGSRVCNYKSDREAVPWACINFGTPDVIHISGRLGTHIEGPTLSTTGINEKKVPNEGHIGLWFHALSQVSEGKISGGGIKEAGSASCAKGLSTQYILDILCKAFSFKAYTITPEILKEGEDVLSTPEI